jgi:hypothetical protein
MLFQIFRHHNNVLVEQSLYNLYQMLDPEKRWSSEQCVSPRHLKVMHSFAQMREAADNAGMGFAATFITDEGYHYTATNLPGVEEVGNIIQYLLSEPLGEDAAGGCIRLVETRDGVQLQIVSNEE